MPGFATQSLSPPVQQDTNSWDYDIDPITGFISYKRFDSFDSTRKIEFLKHFRLTLNMSKAAEISGTNRMTIQFHVDRDRKFARAVTQTKLGIADELTETAKNVALKPEGVRDRWSLIERLNPDEYGKKEPVSQTEIKIILDGKMLEEYSTRQQSIEAELVDPPSSLQLDSQILNSVSTVHSTDDTTETQ